jgi:hypothetical protein
MQPDRCPRSTWRVFLTGLSVRLFGVLLILLGDGYDTLLAKISVVLGVIITVTGMGILRWLLFQSLFRRKPAAE